MPWTFCPQCNPTSGNWPPFSQVGAREIYTCPDCSCSWCDVQADTSDPDLPPGLSMCESIIELAGVLEDHGLVGNVRVIAGAHAYEILRATAGADRLAGVPILNHPLMAKGLAVVSGIPRITGANPQVEVVRRTKPAPSSSEPKTGATWWKKGTTLPVFIVSSIVCDDNQHRVRFKAVGSGIESTVLADFLSNYTLDTPDPGCAVGEEWISETGEILKIEEIRHDRGEIVGTTAQPPRRTVTLANFLTTYKKFVRKTVYDLLVEDD